MKQSIMTLEVSTLLDTVLFDGRNPRVASRNGMQFEDYSHLVESIMEKLVEDGIEKGYRGLTHKILLSGDPKADFLKNPLKVNRGHLRVSALRYIMEHHPDVFTELFPQGKIKCEVLQGATKDEELDLLIDHGDQKPLSKYEGFLAAGELFSSGMSEKAVSVKLRFLIDQHYPLSTKLKLKVTELAVELTAGKITEAAFNEAIFLIRRGVVQHLHRVVRLPAQVLLSEEIKEFGEKAVPEGKKISDYPALTTDQIKKLGVAFKNDSEIKGTNHNKLCPGPEFQKLWTDYIKSGKEGKKEPSKKAMPASKIKEQGNGFCSEGMKALCNLHSGEETTIDVDNVDQDLYLLELVKAKAPDFYAKFTELGNKLVEAINSEAQDEAANG